MSLPVKTHPQYFVLRMYFERYLSPPGQECKTLILVLNANRSCHHYPSKTHGVRLSTKMEHDQLANPRIEAFVETCFPSVRENQSEPTWGDSTPNRNKLDLTLAALWIEVIEVEVPLFNGLQALYAQQGYQSNRIKPRFDGLQRTSEQDSRSMSLRFQELYLDFKSRQSKSRFVRIRDLCRIQRTSTESNA